MSSYPQTIRIRDPTETQDSSWLRMTSPPGESALESAPKSVIRKLLSSKSRLEGLMSWSVERFWRLFVSLLLKHGWKTRRNWPFCLFDTDIVILEPPWKLEWGRWARFFDEVSFSMHNVPKLFQTSAYIIYTCVSSLSQHTVTQPCSYLKPPFIYIYILLAYLIKWNVNIIYIYVCVICVRNVCMHVSM